MLDHGPRRLMRAGLATIAVAGLTLTACSSTVKPDASISSGVRADFSAAAKEFGVPENVLLAISYNMTNWQFSGSTPNEMGGYGPMGLLAGVSASASGHQSGTTATGTVDTTSQLAVAAKAARVSTDAARTNSATNIRAAAALLAQDAKVHDHGVQPKALTDWYTPVAAYSLSASTAGGNAFADDVYETLRKGATAHAGDGETLSLPADPSLPQHVHAAVYHAGSSSNAPEPDCPAELDCRFVPAAYDWSSSDHSNPNNYGNYDPANRPTDGNSIQYIIIHDTESSYDSAISAFQDPAHEASANYVIRSSDGQVTQMVPNGDISWDVANWTMNEHSISIEHEGYAAQGATWYTSAMYRSSAELVAHLAAEYNIPLDANHIISHEDVPGELTANQAGQHWDPGPFWNWQMYMRLLGAPKAATPSAPSKMVTIDPDFASNQPPVTNCDSTGSCTTLPAQGANFVYLRTKPSANAPLINDPLVHPDGSAGTQQASDWSDKAVTGHPYAVAGKQGDWTAIWYDGQRAWFDNPHGATAVPAGGELASVPQGANDVSLYGRATPPLSAYPADIQGISSSFAPTPLTTWKFAAGQSYVVIGKVQASDYYARFDPANVAGNHTLVSDPTEYLMIDYNHRYLFVKATDVQLTQTG